MIRDGSYAGVDLSLRSTGIAVGRPIDGPPDTCTVGYRLSDDAPESDRLTRIEHIADAVAQLDVVGVVMEDLLPGMKTASYAEIVGLHYVVRRELRRVGTPYVLVNVAHLKRYATGKGGGAGTDKRGVALAVARRYALEHVSGDETDAFVLWAMIADHLGYALQTVPSRNREALAGVAWTAAA